MRPALVALALAIPSVVSSYGLSLVLLPRQDPGDNDPTEVCFNTCTQPFFEGVSKLCDSQINEDTMDKCYCENGGVAALEQCVQKCVPANAPSDDPGAHGLGNPNAAEDLKEECARLEKDDSIVVVGAGTSSGTGGDNGAAVDGDKGSGNGKDAGAGKGGATDAGNSAGKSVDDHAGNGARTGAGIISGTILTVGAAVVIAAL